MTTDYDTLQITITAILPITHTLVAGVPTIEAVDYLA